MVLTIQAFALLDKTNSIWSDISIYYYVNHTDATWWYPNCLLLTSFGPRTITKGTNKKKIKGKTKHLIQITKCVPSSLSKIFFSWDKEEAVLEMGTNHTFQKSKMQIKYFANTDRKFQHTLTHKTVKLRTILQPNHVRQKQFRRLRHYIWIDSNSGYVYQLMMFALKQTCCNNLDIPVIKTSELWLMDFFLYIYL